MKLNDMSKPVTAAKLNESLAAKFNTRVNLKDFTLEQLQDSRNKVRTKLFQFESGEKYDAVLTDREYQMNKLLSDVLTAEIAERKLSEHTANTSAELIVEGAEDEAELVMAAKDMVHRVTNWMEDTAQMQTESMLALADSIRDELGSDVSEQFVSTVKPALESLYQAMESTREQLIRGLGIVTGEAVPDIIGADDAESEPEVADDTVSDEIDSAVADDEFAAAPAAVGGQEPAGRAKRESIELSRRLGSLLTSKKK